MGCGLRSKNTAGIGALHSVFKEDDMVQKIVIIGAAVLDIIAAPVDQTVFETGSYPAEEIRMSPGGDALNEATVLAALGKAVRLEFVLGADMEGRMIQEHCRKHGIEWNENAVRADLHTAVNVVLVREDGERSFLTSRKGSLRKLRLSDIHIPFPKDAGILCFASIFVFPHIANAELVQIFRTAKEQGMLICADMTKRKNNEQVEDIAEALSYVDYLMPNEEEAFLLTGVQETEKAAEILFAAGVKNVVLKCGARGCFLYNAEIRKYIPAVSGVDCIDTTGAGDSFAAGFVYGISEGWELEKCAEFANTCGARAVGRVGAVNWVEHYFPQYQNV